METTNKYSWVANGFDSWQIVFVNADWFEPIHMKCIPLTMNAGQLGLGSTWPGSTRPGGNVFNKKRVYSTKVGGRMSDTKKHNFMCCLFHFLYSISADVSWYLGSILYQLDNTILQQVSTNPYLGITLSEDLQWSTHIQNIVKKSNSTLGFLRRNLKNCPEECRKLALNYLWYGQRLNMDHLFGTPISKKT